MEVFYIGAHGRGGPIAFPGLGHLADVLMVGSLHGGSMRESLMRVASGSGVLEIPVWDPAATAGVWMYR